MAISSDPSFRPRVGSAIGAEPAPPYAVAADVGPLGGSASVSVGGVTICSARVRRTARRGIGRWVGTTSLTVDRFTADDPRLLRDETAGGLPVLRDLLRRVIGEPSWRSHVVTVLAECTDPVIIGAVWRLATEIEAGCDIQWSGAEQLVAASIYGRGARSQLRRAISHVPRPATIGEVLSRATARLAPPPRDTGKGGLFVRSVTDADRPWSEYLGLAFRDVSLSDVVLRPLRYADSVQAAEEPLARGERCIVGELHGEEVFRMWVGRPDAGWMARIPPASVAASWYVHDCRTAPEFRRRGIYVSALQWLAGEARAAGVDTIYLHVEGTNVAAIGAVERAGFRHVRAERASPVGGAGLSLARPAVLELVREVVGSGGGIRVRAAGGSMWPAVPDGALVELAAVPSRLRRGRIVLLDWNGTAVLHRVTRVRDDVVETRGDACLERDPPTPRERLVAMAVSIEHEGRLSSASGSLRWGPMAWIRFARARTRLGAARFWRVMRRGWG